jgi:hypothetical protein
MILPVKTFKVVAVLALALALVAPFARGVAQQQTAASTSAPAKTTAEISGVVVDSLHSRYLAGAEVVIEGVNGTLVTDSAGSFKIAGIPPGTYQIGVFHPILDTLNISLASRPFHVGPDSASFVILSVPSAKTIIRSACPAYSAAQGSSAVIGHVNDPETLKPVAGAEVSLAWIQIEISTQTGIKRTPHVLRDTTNASGSFHLCGLPNSMQASLQARKGTAATSEVPVALGDAETELLARTLLLSPTASSATTGNATVSGKVVLEGTPANGPSRVELVGTNVVAMTNEAGDFTMTNLPSGSHVLLARHLGYGAATAAVDLTSREPQKVTIKLPKFVALMDPVLVVARRNVSLDRVGFNERKKGANGYFLGPEQLQRIHANYLTDIFRRVPGLRVTSNGFDEVVSSSRGATSLMGGDCVQYYLDDMPWTSASPGDINTFVNGSEVVGVEVYQPASTPGRYTRGLSQCTTIVLWTRFKIRDLKEK